MSATRSESEISSRVLEDFGLPPSELSPGDGTLELIQQRILGIAQEQGMIRWEYGAVDGSFSPWKRRW